MRRILLATTAAAALVAGSSLAMAQVSGGANAGANAGANVQQHQGGTGGTAGTHGNAGAQGNVRAQGNAGTRGMTQNQRGGQNEHMGQAREERGHARGEERNERLGQGRQQGNQRMGQQERNERLGRTNDRDRNLRGEQRNERLGQRERGVREGRGGREQAYRPIQDETRGAREHGATTRLSSDQRTRIHERLFTEGGEHRLAHADFAVRRGVRIPHSVHLYSLPADIVTLVPAYRDYEYILVGENIVIVDPVTYEIIDVIPA
jgi:hypothetical protein